METNLTPKILTLCLTKKEGMVLLGMKKRGFGEGRWNGFGGKVEEGETIIDAAIREMREESGLRIEDLEEKGIINFHFLDTGKFLEVHVFNVLRCSGNMIETEEMSPKWFNLDEIPFENMWADDIYWFPLFLKGCKFRGDFVFENNDKMLSHEIKIVDD
jgi:8-oxo-dGTP diphosphatase/2-hydroxy-dATP diphosphatase